MDDAECEPLVYVDLRAYHKRTGSEMPERAVSYPPIVGERWHEDDLDLLYPKLCGKIVR